MPYTPEELKRMLEFYGFDKEKPDDNSEDKKSDLEDKVSESGLVVASGNGIYCVSPGERFLVAERSNLVYALVSHDGRLFDGGWYKAVFDTLENKKVGERSASVCALVSHDGRLFDGGNYNAVFDTLDDRRVAERSDAVYALVSHDGRLFDSGDYKAVFDTLNDKKVGERSGCVYALVSHEGRLFDGGYKAVFDTLNNERVVERSDWVCALVSHEGRLFDGGYYKAVFDTLEDGKGESPLWTFDSPVYAMVSVPMSLWNELVERVKKERSVIRGNENNGKGR